MRRVVQRWAWVTAAAAVITGCRPREQPVQPAAPVGAGRRVALGSGRRAGSSTSPVVAVASSPVQLLPDSTVAVISATGVQALLGVVEVDALVRKYRPYYDQAAAEVTKAAGVNLLDPGQWSQVGLDATGPMGAAMVDMPSETVLGFVTLTDRDRFRAFLDRVGNGQLVPVLEDRGVVLRSDPDATSAVVLRDRYAFFVSTGRPARASYDFARSLATIDPARGLTSAPRYQQAVASDEPARPLTAYVDVWGILEPEFTRTQLSGEREPSWAEQELERAQANGAPQEELQRLRQQVDDDRRWEEQRRLRKQAEFDVLSRWFRGIGPMVFEFTANQEGVVGRVRSRMAESSPWRAALRNAAAPSPVLTALGERPVVLVGGSVDVVQAQALLEDMMRLEGADPAKEYAEFREETTIDLQREVFPILTGTGGFALTISEALQRGEYKRGDQEIGFAVAFGVNSADRAQAVLQRAVQKVPAKLGKERKTGAFMLEIPDYRTVYAAVVAGQVVVTTDLGVVQRLATEAKGGLAKLLAPAAVPVVTARDTAVQTMLDIYFPVLTFVSRRGSYAMPTRAPEEPYMMFPDVPHAKVDRVPRSRAYRAKLREWEATDAKIRREEEAEERRQAKAITGIAEALGVQAWNMKEHPDGLVARGGHYFGKGGLTRAIERIAEYSAQPRSEKIWEMYSARAGLEDELRRIRVVDVAQALGVPTPMSP